MEASWTSVLLVLLGLLGLGFGLGVAQGVDALGADGIGAVVASRKRGGLWGARTGTRLALEIPSMQECPNTPDNSLHFYNMSVGMRGKTDFVIHGEYNITRRANGVSQLRLDLTKCREVVSANTCEHFQTWRFNKDVCTLMFNNKIFSKFNNHVHPRPGCPTRVGTYHIRNATLDMNALQSLPLPLEGNVWFVRYMMIEADGRTHVCADTELRFHRVREE